MKILKYPNSFLFKKVESVSVFNEQLKAEAQEMIEVMKKHEGVGLAANQVGIDKRIFVMQCTEEKEPYIFINPIIMGKSYDKDFYQEGCLSFPELYIELERNKTVKLQWQDINGKTKEEEFSKLEAICIQHEIEHLEGIVFVNKLKPMKKQTVLNKYMKMKSKK